jgi:hypothetical protein
VLRATNAPEAAQALGTEQRRALLLRMAFAARALQRGMTPRQLLLSGQTSRAASGSRDALAAELLPDQLSRHFNAVTAAPGLRSHPHVSATGMLPLGHANFVLVQASVSLCRTHTFRYLSQRSAVLYAGCCNGAPVAAAAAGRCHEHRVCSAAAHGYAATTGFHPAGEGLAQW